MSQICKYLFVVLSSSVIHLGLNMIYILHILFASNGYMSTDLELSRFDAIVVSSEVGYEKPAPEIFKIALGRDKIEFGL